MIKAVIFDCFGVLTTDGWLAFRERYFSNSPDLLEKGIVSNKRVDAGLITYGDFIHEIAQLANVSDQKAVTIIENNSPNDALFDFIRDELKSTYKIGMLSNAGANWLDRLFEPWQAQLFDEVVMSYEVGVVKPDPLMYQTLINRLGLLPEECLYIDDQIRYVEGATKLGMIGIHFNDTTSTIANIEELLHA